MSDLSAEDAAFVNRFMQWKHRPKDYGAGSEADLPVQQIYRDLMKVSFGPTLRQNGIKGSGGRFELPSEKYWAQLGFQKSAFSDSSDLKFTINLSVISRDVWNAQSAARPHLGQKPTPSLLYGDWASQVRIGQLMQSTEDHWWRLRRGEDATEVAEDVISALVDLAVPWLITASSVRPLRQAVDRRRPRR